MPFFPELPNITYIDTYPAMYLLQGSNTNITCEAIGSPPPVISWTFNGQPTPYQSIISSSALPSATCGTIDPRETVSVLLIANFSSNGNYTCNATNINGSSWQSVYLEVQGNEANMSCHWLSCSPFFLCLPLFLLF